MTEEQIDSILSQEQEENQNIYEIMQLIGKKRGAIVSGGNIDDEKTSKIILDEEKNLIVYVTLSVKENAIIKELSTNLQTKIKSAIKKTSDLEVKEVNISIKELQSETSKTIE